MKCVKCVKVFLDIQVIFWVVMQWCCSGVVL